MANIYELYLRIALWCGFTDYAFRLSERWGSYTKASSRAKYAAAWSIQETLIEEYGYFECPSCQWATKEEHEHLKVLGWCFEQQLAHELRQRVVGFASSLIDNIMAEARAISGMEFPEDDEAPKRLGDDEPTFH